MFGLVFFVICCVFLATVFDEFSKWGAQLGNFEKSSKNDGKACLDFRSTNYPFLGLGFQNQKNRNRLTEYITILQSIVHVRRPKESQSKAQKAAEEVRVPA